MAIERTNRVNTVRRPYTAAGLLLDVRRDRTVEDPMEGAAFSDADVSSFFSANSTLQADTFAGQGHVLNSL